jgi:hypothetical protein
LRTASSAGSKLRGFEVHGTATAGGLDSDASGRFHLLFDVAPGETFFLSTSGDAGGGGQSSNGIGQLQLIETTGLETLLSFRSGESPVNLAARALIAPGSYELTFTYGAIGFSAAQADLVGTFTNAVPLPPAVWSGAATLGLAVAARGLLRQRHSAC